MNFDPTDPSLRNRRPRPQLARRDVLRGGMWLSIGIGAAPLLSACNDQTPATNQKGGSAPYPLARPDDPVTLPLKDNNPAIEDGIAPETGGVFKILNYADYMAPGVMKTFGQKYDVEVEVTPYNNYDQMVAKLREPGAAFDLVFPGPSVLSKIVYGELLQPLNHSYVPNLANVWPEYQDPWYDLGAQYTVPYTVYTTGVAYRADRVSSVPENGYDLLWDEQYSGKTYILDDQGEAIGMSLLRNDITRDINTGDPEFVHEATDHLIDLIDAVKVKTGVSAYSLIPEGTATVHQAWSGDMIAGQYYLPKGESTDVLAYWRPEANSDRVTGNDIIAIPKSAEKPVLGHLMINDLLDNDISLRTSASTATSRRSPSCRPNILIDEGYIPPNLEHAVVLAGRLQGRSDVLRDESEYGGALANLMGGVQGRCLTS